MMAPTATQGMGAKKKEDTMRITLNLPDTFAKLPSQQQQDIKNWTETRLQIQLDLAEGLKAGKYSAANAEIIREALRRTDEAKATGISKAELFQEFRQVVEKIGMNMGQNF